MDQVDMATALLLATVLLLALLITARS